jgi:5'-deoxynucleotidase YfbR-like HD superfamily hydrolase
VVPDVIPRTIATIDGQLVNPFTVTATDGVFRVDTIAHALSNLCRYNGHTERFYSVAEHCLLVQLVVDVHATGLGLTPEQRAILSFEALVHDAVEAYLGDIPAPFKKMPEFAAYRQAEARLSKELRKWFGLTGDEPQLVRQIGAVFHSTKARDSGMSQ